jgi:hypothetical protein
VRKIIRPYRFEIVVLALAALLRVGAIAVYGDFTQPQLYEYGGIARHVLAGHGYAQVFPILHPDYGIAPRTWDAATPTAFTMPGYPLIMTAVLGILGDNGAAYATLYALNLLVALLSLFELYILTAYLLSKPAARIALVLAAVFPPLVAATATFGGTVWTHLIMLAALLLVTRAASGVRRDERAHGGASRGAFLLAGLVSGLWIVFRGEALGVVLLLALWMWWKQEITLRNVVVYLGAALLVLLPWSLRNSLVFDRVVPLTTNFWLNAWRGNHEGTTGGAFKPEGGSNWLTPAIRAEIERLPHTPDYELRVMDIYRARTMDFLRTQPAAVARLYARKIAMFLSVDWSDRRARHPLLLYPQLLLVLAAAAGGVLLSRRRRFPVPIGLAIAVTGLSVAALHIETRYILMMGILYIVLAAAALEAAWTRLFPRRGASSAE